MNSYRAKLFIDLHDFIERNLENLIEIDSDNITGVHVGRKIRDGVELNYYSIVFHVKKKKQLNKISSIRKIPTEFHVEFSFDRSSKVKTDIQELGLLSLEADIGLGADTYYKNLTSKSGALGLIVRRNSHLYSLSNMHVYGASLLKKSFYYLKDIDQTDRPDITIRNKNYKTKAILEEGILSKTLDVAIARVIDPSVVSNLLPNNQQILGHKNIASEKYIGYRINMYQKSSNPILKSGKMEYHSALKKFKVNNKIHTIQSLLQIKPKISRKGDSGSVVFDKDNLAVGIHIGSDNKYSYSIPITNILSFLGARIY